MHRDLLLPCPATANGLQRSTGPSSRGACMPDICSFHTLASTTLHPVHGWCRRVWHGRSKARLFWNSRGKLWRSVWWEHRIIVVPDDRTAAANVKLQTNLVLVRAMACAKGQTTEAVSWSPIVRAQKPLQQHFSVCPDV